MKGSRWMPRYFFNVRCGEHLYRDWVGQEFSSVETALGEARLVAGELVRDAAFANRPLDHVLEVTNVDGITIISFRCSDPEIMQAQRRPGA
jgi:hypothetical protein